jgi:hypothetical protein
VSSIQQVFNNLKKYFLAFTNVYCYATLNFTIRKGWDRWEGFFHHLSAQELVVVIVSGYGFG